MADELAKVGARDLSPSSSRTRPQGLALAGSKSETRRVQALRHLRRTATMPRQGDPSLPVSECLSDSPLLPITMQPYYSTSSNGRCQITKALSRTFLRHLTMREIVIDTETTGVDALGGPNVMATRSHSLTPSFDPQSIRLSGAGVTSTKRAKRMI